MKNFMSRLQKLEELSKGKNEPVLALIEAKEKEDKYFWAKMFGLLTNEELKEFDNLIENQESLELLNKFLIKYESQAHWNTLSHQKKALIDKVVNRVRGFTENERMKLRDKESVFTRKFWGEMFEGYPV